MSPAHLLLFTFLPFAYRILHANGYRGFLRRKQKEGHFVSFGNQSWPLIPIGRISTVSSKLLS